MVSARAAVPGQRGLWIQDIVRNEVPREPSRTRFQESRDLTPAAFYYLTCHALRAGFTIEEIFGLTKIDRWFLVQIKEIVDFEEKPAGAKN